MPGQFTAVGFESLKGGDAATVFRFLPGGRLDGSLTGGSSSGDVLTYQDFGRAVTIDLENRRATGIGGTFSNLETLVGSALGADSITLTNSNDFVLTRENNSGLVNGVLSFRDIEGINGGAGNDTFRFEGYATFSNLISGGSGFDTLGIYAQAGFHNFVTSENVFIREGQVSINPVWNFSSIEALVVDTGGGNDTVTTEFTSFSQTLQGGAGDDTLNFRQAPFGSTSPVSQAGYGKVGFESFEHLNFAPPPNASDTPATLGELLQIQLNKAAPLNPTLIGTGLVTFATSTTQLGLGINLGPTLLAGVSAIPSSTSIVSAEDFDYGIMVYPFALDNSGIQPSNLGIQLLQQALALEANIELLNALELKLGFVVIYPDGAVAMDLRMVTPPQTAILVIARQLSPFSQMELQSALEMENRFWATQADGAFPLGVLPITLSPATLTRLSEILSDPSQAELNAAFNAE